MHKLKQIGALLLVFILVALVLLTLYFAVIGSRYFMASLVVTLVFPVLLYAYMLVYRIVKKNGQEKESADGDEK